MSGSGYWEREAPDILIATTISGWELVSYEWHESMLNAILSIPKGLKATRVKFPEPEISVSRDKALATAIQAGARWLWFVDSDLSCPPDTLERLIAHDKPIVGGLYVRRHNPPFNEMLRMREDGPGLRPILDGEYEPGSLVECDSIATGCMLLRTDAIERIKPFKVTINDQPARDAHFLWTEYRLPTGASEDFSFCMNARASGIPVYCDTSILCKHVGPVRFVPSGKNELQIEFVGT